MTSPLHPFLSLPEDLRRPEECAAWILPVPYERTSSYRRGSRSAPAAILRASDQLETMDEETGTEPCRLGIATLPPLEVPEGTPEEGIAYLREKLQEVTPRAPLLACIGGEHTLSAPAVEAAVARHGDLTVLQLDAHADLRDSYDGTPWSHACAARRIVETAPVVGVGIRAVSPQETRDIERLPVRHFMAWECQAAKGWQERVLDRLGDRVYVTVDMDVFDPSLAPAVGTPEPGGLDWWPVLGLLRLVAREREVVGMDLVECNAADWEDRTAYLCARLLYKMIGSVIQARTERTAG